MPSIEESAKAHFANYASVIKSGEKLMDATSPEDQEERLEAWMKTLMKLFLPGAVGFGGGPPQQAPSLEVLHEGIKMRTAQYLKHNIGFTAEPKSSEVKVVIDYGEEGGAAIIDVIWATKAHEKSGLSEKGWDMHAVYGYRKMPTGEEGWEFGYQDDEIHQLLKRVPNFFDGLPSLSR
jgi:hypothetical protein